MIVRTLTSSDFAAFAALQASFCAYAGEAPQPEDEARRLFDAALDPDKNLHFIVAEKDGTLVGMLSLTIGQSSYKISPFAWCDDFFVSEEYRRLGVGRALMAQAQLVATNSGCSNILVGVGNQERQSLAFYARRGFVDMQCRLLTLPLA